MCLFWIKRCGKHVIGAGDDDEDEEDMDMDDLDMPPMGEDEEDLGVSVN